jgi:hypothetical protein
MGRGGTPSGPKFFFSSLPKVGRSANLPGQSADPGLQCGTSLGFKNDRWFRADVARLELFGNGEARLIALGKAYYRSYCSVMLTGIVSRRLPKKVANERLGPFRIDSASNLRLLGISAAAFSISRSVE